MELTIAPPITNEQALVRNFASHTFFSRQYSFKVKERLEILADSLFHYFPAEKQDFLGSDRYKKYQEWIREHYIVTYYPPETHAVLRIRDWHLARQLSQQEKQMRTELSNSVSDCLRRMVNFIYPKGKSSSGCQCCKSRVTKLELRCLSCRSTYHFECLQKLFFLCDKCGRHLIENQLVVYDT